MAYKIEELEGVGAAYAAKLEAAGIHNFDDLLEKCAAAKGRESIAEATGISSKLILRWANMADLSRIKGVGPQISELMEAAGVDTVKELRNRNAANLAAKMEEVNAEKKLTKAQFSENQIQGFIDHAKTLDPCITH